ncbi:MAG: proton-conducting transporter membrane subunit [Thioalkalispiraceae bacterium]|jgi:NADH:ubiquinone oxidoreductase subunit 5 (subunit L)/multisubunit Na+/H+ antiporter MnhA subunit
MLNQIALLIPSLPWLAAMIIAVSYLFFNNRGERGEKFTANLSLIAILASLILIIIIDVVTLQEQNLPGDIVYLQWLKVDEVSIDISLKLDQLGLLMVNLFTVLLLVTVRFSTAYMHREEGFQRFFFILCLFSGAMQLMVIAGNAALTFFAWEIAGVSSYLLIGYVYQRKTATRNANQAFITNRIGDAGFILALIIGFLYLGDSQWSTINSSQSKMPDLAISSMALGLVIAAMVKSAQLPFSSWISQALEGPTPSSAIFYGALIIHAGAFLLIRMQPLLENIPILMLIITIIGSLTAVYGYLVGLTQTDVKSSLIFSSISQVGLIFMFCGLGWFTLATLYLVAHTIWRTYQFLNAPSMMHWMEKPMRPVPSFIRNNLRLYTLSQQRFWLDPISKKVITTPIHSLARDLRYFDDHIVNRLVGLPSSVSALSSLAHWDAYHANRQAHISGDTGMIGRGRGIAGKMIEWLARPLHWIENHLVLKTGEEGIEKSLKHLGHYFSTIDSLLSQPRYLWLIIFITLFISM